MTRHSWGEPNRMAKKTERECKNGCGIIKVTLHPDGREGRRHSVEFYRDGDQIECKGTPACTGPAKATVTYDARTYPL
jgi:hypothetical protein